MPGRVHPPAIPRYTASPVEPEVHAQLLGALPDGWVAWHSLRFSYGRHRLIREIDFLLLVPRRGLLVVEVKGGRGWRREAGNWFRDGQPARNESPLDQALGANAALRQMLADALGRDAVPASDVLVWFPGMHATSRPSGSDLDDRSILGSDHARLGERLAALARAAFPADEPSLPWTRLHDTVHRAWGESWTPTLRPDAAAKLRASELVRLDDEQRALASDCHVRGRMLIVGGPGTGKSVVARAILAKALHDERRVLYLCYTIALAIGMRSTGIRDAHPIRHFAREVLLREGIELPAGPAAAWSTEAWDTMMRTAAELIPLADVELPELLVLDEVQDFGPLEWSIVDALARADVPVVAFGDPGQQVLAHATYDEARFAVTFHLRRPYRNPPEIQELACALRDGRALPPESLHVRRSTVAAHESVVDAVGRALTTLASNGAKPNEIAVLSVESLGRMTRFPEAESVGGYPISPADGSEAGERVVVDTALRFKGLERSWVILIDLPHDASERARQRAYIAATRATMGVILVPKPAAQS